ncbi:light-harvesting antenna LH1, alpha subunit [Thiorhodospira sibirica]|uniref:light-harvesting antenna LH1, alpha subunit n=1 Tax=Thiorhodospira sibirica TaxID=154347 RepID=UPI00022C04AF|nr:light-harvesting antenna LH1, alpha subunit [Thiorhodospira sibirica]
MSDERVPSPSNPADDWKMWLVVNPATWLMPILFSLLVLGIAIHFYVFSIPGMGWTLAS